MQLHEEIEKSYREKFQKQEMEMEEFRSTCNKLKHELFFLKSEYEHEQTESRQILAEMKLQHDAEVGHCCDCLSCTISIETRNIRTHEKLTVGNLHWHFLFRLFSRCYSKK